jgi:hypothetical protein
MPMYAPAQRIAPGRVEKEELAIAQAHRGSRGNRDRRYARNELCDQEQRRAVAREEVVGLAYARVGRDREATDGVEHATPIAPPDSIPEVVRREGCEEGRHEDFFRAQRLAVGDRSRDDQDRRGRKR